MVICTVARLFWAEGKIEKARDWFKRSTATDPDLGDSWAWWWRFEMEHGTKVGFPVFAFFSYHTGAQTLM
jgi:pre-mRNA-processing factor 6